MTNKGLRTFLAVATGLVVIYFGSTNEERGVTNALIVLGIAAGLLVWYLTKPGKQGPVS